MVNVPVASLAVRRLTVPSSRRTRTSAPATTAPWLSVTRPLSATASADAVRAQRHTMRARMAAPKRGRRRRRAGWRERVEWITASGMSVSQSGRQSTTTGVRRESREAAVMDVQCMLSVLRRKAANNALGRSPGSEAAAWDTQRVASPSLAGNVRQDRTSTKWLRNDRPHSQWRNRAGLAPDFPVMPVVGTQGSADDITPRRGRPSPAASPARRSPRSVSERAAGRRGSRRADRPGGRSTAR